jgi:hypothetical protein
LLLDNLVVDFLNNMVHVMYGVTIMNS